MTQTNKNQIPLEHSHSGDVVLIGAPGYVMGSDIEKNVSPPIELGTHGGTADRSMLRPVFMATQEDFYKRNKLNPCLCDHSQFVIETFHTRTVPCFIEVRNGRTRFTSFSTGYTLSAG